MPDPCLVLVAAVCLSRQAHVETISNPQWGGARIELDGITITSVVRSDSGVFPDRRFMPKYCLGGTCMYYHVHCSTEGSTYFCRVSYNEPGDIFSRQLEISAPDSARMSSVFGQIRIRGFRSGRLFPVASFRDVSPDPYPPYCRVGTDRGCGTGSDDMVAVASSPSRDNVGRARHSRCDIGNLDLVFSDPVSFQNKIYCGQVFVRQYHGTLRVTRTSNEVPSYDVSFLVPADGRSQLPNVGERPGSFFIRARIDPQVECFVARTDPRDEEGCVPYRRPVYLHITSAERDAHLGPQTPARAADRLPPRAPSIDEDRIAIDPVGATRGPNRPSDQGDHPQAGLHLLALASPGRDNAAATAPTTYTASGVVNNISALNGRTVRVSGYLVIGQDARALWDSHEDVAYVSHTHASGADPIWNHCITAYYDFSIARIVQNASGSDVEVIGTIDDNRNHRRGVDLWGCNDISISIHRIIFQPGSNPRSTGDQRLSDRNALSSDNDDRIPGSPVGTVHSPSRPNEQGEPPQF